MKQIINREEDAVSPIIATIILIAITIVLAATLYTALTYYASNSSTSTPPTAVEISATLTKGLYYNCTDNGGSPIQLDSNNTTFYELKINSINGCDGNISLFKVAFIITYKNGTCCGKTLIELNQQPYPYNISYSCRNPCATRVATFNDPGKNYSTGAIAINNFIFVALHPVWHMISSSVYIFIPAKARPNNGFQSMAPQNQICSIEVINHVRQFVLFSVNTS